MTTQLFEKYLQAQCTPEEKAEVENWLVQCKPEQLDEVLLPIWNNSQGDILPEVLENRLVKQIPALRKKKNRVVQAQWWRAVAAAVLVGAFFLAGRQWLANDETIKPVIAAVTPQKNASADTVISNNNANIKQVILPDGSAITLYQHASIRYDTGYNKEERNIKLEGRAIFSVAKDKQRPFTVYSRHLATTALGTKFLVDASAAACTQVKLYEGKILVKSNKTQQILMPGDSLVYSDAKGSLLLKQPNIISKDANRWPVKNAGVDTVHFFQTPLQEVFTTLAKKYKTTIQFNSEELKGMNFTGEVSAGTPLSKIIRLIADMNGLQCENRSKGYTIRSK